MKNAGTLFRAEKKVADGVLPRLRDDLLVGGPERAQELDGRLPRLVPHEVACLGCENEGAVARDRLGLPRGRGAEPQLVQGRRGGDFEQPPLAPPVPEQLLAEARSSGRHLLSAPSSASAGSSMSSRAGAVEMRRISTRRSSPARRRFVLTGRALRFTPLCVNRLRQRSYCPFLSNSIGTRPLAAEGEISHAPTSRGSPRVRPASSKSCCTNSR